MTANQHLTAFVAMAAAIVAIVVIGTLAAADILHVGRRRRGSRTSAVARRPDLTVSPVGEDELVASSAGRPRADQ